MLHKMYLVPVEKYQTSPPAKRVHKRRDYEDKFLEKDTKAFERKYVCPVSSPYLRPYVYNWRFLATQYGIRRDGDYIRVPIPR